MARLADIRLEGAILSLFLELTLTNILILPRDRLKPTDLVDMFHALGHARIGERSLARALRGGVLRSRRGKRVHLLLHLLLLVLVITADCEVVIICLFIPMLFQCHGLDTLPRQHVATINALAEGQPLSSEVVLLLHAIQPG